MRIFFCGDVMTGRGIDQVLPHPSDPAIHESHIRSALGYVALAEERSGAFQRPVDFRYIWGDALAAMDEMAPDLRVVNLETSITGDGIPEPKGINYRMSPANIGSIQAAKIDCCTLANNHVADWGMAALSDTVSALAAAGIATAGAGGDLGAAERPALLYGRKGERVLVFAFGCASSGVPDHWAAGEARPGVNFLSDCGRRAIRQAISVIRRWRRAGDLAIVSIHWGPNWGYDIAEAHRRFAHALIDRAGVSVIHGHSSHHPIGIEVYRGRPILFGCGDFINDYEGITGYEAFRPDLALAYFVDIDDRTGELAYLEMMPFRLERFRLRHADARDVSWLAEQLDRQVRRFGHCVDMTARNTLRLRFISDRATA